MPDEASRRVDGGRIFWGIVLLSAGGLLFANQVGWLALTLPHAWWRYTPLVIVALGLQHLLFPGPRVEQRADGIWLISVGLILLSCTTELLRWSEAWPLYIVAAGAQMIWRASVRRKESRHDG